jgi:ketosteroid isomerase-like protein
VVSYARTHPQRGTLALRPSLHAGDLESILALYEPEATFVAQPGETVTGTEALRGAFGGFLALKPTFELEVKKVFRAGDRRLFWRSLGSATATPK